MAVIGMATEPGSERRATMSATGLTALRAGASALVAGLTLSRDGMLGAGRGVPADHPELVASALGVAVALLLGWLWLERRANDAPTLSRRPLLGVLLLLSAVSGVVSAVPTATAMIGFTVMAAVAAGAELDSWAACAVAVTAILAVEVSSLIYRFTVGDAVGWAVAVVVAVLVGRNRRDARTQRMQTSALLAQVERTRAEEQRAATLDERARIAREIHDLLAHSLGALGIQLEAAMALMSDKGDIDQGFELVARARRLAASSLAETRQAIEALRTDSPPLPEGLAGLIDHYGDLHHGASTLIVTGAPRALTAEANLALIRTTHEALTNAAKHAPTAPVTVRLDYGDDQVTVSVTDMPSSAGSTDSLTAEVPSVTGGYGLTGMRERLMLIGGSLTAGPEGQGWTVRAQVPA